MEVVISIVSLTVIATVTVILLYQNASVRDNVAANMQSVVDQINDTTYYGYQYDKRQEDNIKSLDDNIKTVSKDVKNVFDEVKGIKVQFPTNVDISKRVNTEHVSTKTMNAAAISTNDLGANQMSTNILTLGDHAKLTTEPLYDYPLQRDKFAYLNGNINFNGAVNIKGGTSFGNAMNTIGGNTEIKGNTTSTGKMRVNENLFVRNGVQTQVNEGGRILWNTSDPGVHFGMRASSGENFEISSSSQKGGIQLGFQNDKGFAPTLAVRPQAVTVGSGPNRMHLEQTVDNGFTIRTEDDKGKVTFKTRDRTPLEFDNGVVRMGNAILPVNLNVAGNIMTMGNQFQLGLGNSSNGDTKESRALVKGPGGELILNYESDFPKGVMSHSDLRIRGDKCLETGADKIKEVNSGKICYLDNGLVINGAGASGQFKNVRVNDILHTKSVKAQTEMCVGQACLNEDKLNKILNNDGYMCIGSTCLTEADIIKIKNMDNVVRTKRVELGKEWHLQAEGTNNNNFVVRDMASGNDARYVFPANKYVNF